MDDFLGNLLFYCLEKQRTPRSLRRHREEEALEAMEEQIETAMGTEFWERYIDSSLQCRREEEVDAFRAGLRFGMELLLHSAPITSS